MTQPMFILIYIIPSLLISPILSISLNSWFMIWMSLEFNLMSFIPFIIFFNKLYKTLAIKYFIIQVFSSSLLILSSNSQLISINENFNLIMLWILNLAILMKIGAAPLHMWFINMMNNLNWMSCLILSTWQKMIPMILLMYCFNIEIIYYFSIISCVIGTIMPLNHQSLRLILSYSSINHTAWMLISLTMSELLWNLYFFSYMLINSSIMIILNKFKIFYLTQLFMLNKMKFLKYILMFNLISMSGLPPMFGFMMKWTMLYTSVMNKNFMLIMILIMMSLLNFLVYTRMYLSTLIQFNMTNKFFMMKKIKYLNPQLFYLNLIIINSFFYSWILMNWFM